jgi:hypothetical protein
LTNTEREYRLRPREAWCLYSMTQEWWFPVHCRNTQYSITQQGSVHCYCVHKSQQRKIYELNSFDVSPPDVIRERTFF